LGIRQGIRKRRILRPSVGIEKEDLVGKIVESGLKNDAPDGRNADAAREKDGWDLRVVVERERAIRSVQRKFRAKSSMVFNTRLNAVSRIRVANIR